MAERGRARARTWPAAAGARRPEPWGIAGFAGELRDRAYHWLLAEVGPGRLVPWLPVAFGAGIVVYFTAPREPLLWAAILLLGALAGATIAWRARPVGLPVVLGLAAAAAGFATATVRTDWIAHPVLRHFVPSAAITGWVEVRESRERTDRIVIRVHQIEGRRLAESPGRVRLSVRKGTAPTVGQFVELKARLNPPLAPLKPGSYDFSRDLYFQGIGATGFVSGDIKATEPKARPAFWVRYAAFIQGMRDGIDQHIRAALPGDKAAIASALLTGTRDAISGPVNDAMYISSLAHVLSISGYHMAVVAGVVFFVIRALLALIPGLAARHPIKKWAALGALAAATFYLLLSGAEVATQRSYYMIGIVLLAVLVDRTAVTFRTLAIAALAVLLLAPEAVVHPSFQMSFAATLALVAGYRHGLPFAKPNADTSFGARIALWGVREILSLIFASLLAGLATTPYAAFHFHRMAPYGVLANLLAMPVVSAWVMPAGMLALLAMPFGFDDFFWRLMGDGLQWMIDVALWVASLPGAVGRVTAFGTGALLVITAGMLVVCLLRTPLRWIGALILALGIVWAVRTPLPDVLVAQGADLVGVRTAGGNFSIIKKGGDSFAVREWLAADADPRTSGDPGLAQGVSCDEIGCIARLADGTIVSLATAAEAYEDDCRLAGLIVTAHRAPPECAAQVIDRTLRARTGALALRRIGNQWEITPARPDGYDRPWAPRNAPEAAPAEAQTSPSKPAAPAAKRDATPRSEDLEPGD